MCLYLITSGAAKSLVCGRIVAQTAPLPNSVDTARCVQCLKRKRPNPLQKSRITIEESATAMDALLSKVEAAKEALEVERAEHQKRVGYLIARDMWAHDNFPDLYYDEPVSVEEDEANIVAAPTDDLESHPVSTEMDVRKQPEYEAAGDQGDDDTVVVDSPGAVTNTVVNTVTTPTTTVTTITITTTH